MNDIQIKICGLKRAADIRLCMDQGVDILGFVTEYPIPVPWNVSRHEALPLLNLVRPPCRSCIVTGGTPEKVIELASSLRPSRVQLHYMESLADTITIADALQKLHIDVIKTVPIKAEDRIAQFGTADIEVIVAKLCTTGIHGLLVDSRGPSNAGAGGNPLDLDLCAGIIALSTKPVFIAGGIKADNVRHVLEKTGAQCIDIMTGVETRPGEKDPTLLSRLVASVRDWSFLRNYTAGGFS